MVNTNTKKEGRMMKEEERFMKFVYPEPNTGCWIFSGADNGYGYSGFRRSVDNGGKWEKAHRVSYKMFIGEIPNGLELDHLCRVRCCVNSQHLEPVTSKENSRRGLTGINFRSVTHCKKGHLYSGDNLYITPTGGRDCKACRNLASKKYRSKLL